MAFLYGLTKIVVGRMPEGLDGLYTSYHNHDPLLLVVGLGALLGAACGYARAMSLRHGTWLLIAAIGLIGLSLAFFLPASFRPVTTVGRLEYALAGGVIGLVVARVLQRIGV